MHSSFKLLARRAAALSLLTFALPLRAAVDLKVDINQRSATNNTAANTESGFVPFAITSPATGVVTGSTANSLVVGAQTVTITGTATGTANTYDDRKRAAPVASGTFTQTALLQDFIFALYSGTANVNAGLDISISGLEANRPYDVTLWSYDASSTGTRVSDWSANGTLKVNNYTFNGATAPTTNTRYQINFTATANASGVLLISGRRDATSVDAAATPAPSHGVFLNAFHIRDSADSEPDGMNDVWEADNGLIVGVDDGGLDADSDFSTNLEEFLANTNPRDTDTDDDTLLDGYEKKTGTWGGPTAAGTDPLNPDTDGDGLGDGLENPDLAYAGPTQPGTNPNLADTDGDTFFDREEVQWPTDPRNPALFPNPAAGATLAIDTENTAAFLQTGFSELLGSGAVDAASLNGTYGPYSVTVSAAGSTTLQSRDRGVTSARGGFTPMFRDFIFATNSGDDGDGMDITVTGLAPLTWYPVTLWAWDPTSAATPRHSTWLASDGDSGTVVKVPLYSLEGATLPASGKERRMKFDARSDSAGTLVIQGRKENGYVAATINVFLNGFIIGPPVTPIRFTNIAGPQLTFTSDAIGTYEVLASHDLLQWSNIAPAVDGQPGTTTFTDPAAGLTRRFYQVRRVSP